VAPAGSYTLTVRQGAGKQRGEPAFDSKSRLQPTGVCPQLQLGFSELPF
jgi:hypothetical protein